MTDAKKKTTAGVKPRGKGRTRIALVGGHLPSGERFEQGDELADLDAATIASLEANGIIEKAGA